MIDVELVLTADGTLTIDGVIVAVGAGDPVTVGLDHVTERARALGRPLVVRAVDETGKVTVLTVHPDGRAEEADTPDTAAAPASSGSGPGAMAPPRPAHNGHVRAVATTVDQPGIDPAAAARRPAVPASSLAPPNRADQARPEQAGPPPPATPHRQVPHRDGGVTLRLVDAGDPAAATAPEPAAPPAPRRRPRIDQPRPVSLPPWATPPVPPVPPPEAATASPPPAGAAPPPAAGAGPGPGGPLSAGSLLNHHVPRELRPAQWGWRSWLRLSPGSAEQLHRARVSTVRRPLTGPRTVVVVNPKGGAGKTPATLMIAATLGAHRGGALAWDNNETRGTLGLRALAHPDTTRTVWDLLADVDHFQTARARIGDLAAYTRPQGEARFDVLASDGDPARMAQVDAVEFRRIREVLTRFYGILVVDTGNNVRAGNWQAAVDAADALVVVTTYQADTAQTAGWVLDHLRSTGRGRLADHAVTVLTAARPAVDPAVRRELVAHYSGVTRAVVEIPYDPVIATGQTLDLYALHQRTREAWLAATAAVADGLTDPPHPLRDT